MKNDHPHNCHCPSCMHAFELWLKAREKEIELIPGHKGEPFFKSKEEENAYNKRMSQVAEELRQAALDRARAVKKITNEELLERIQKLEKTIKKQQEEIKSLDRQITDLQNNGGQRG